MTTTHSESREDYLESILILKRRTGAVRSIDIAEYFNYSRPSVSRAMSILRKDDLISVDRNGYIDLTDEGRRQAEAVFARHETLMLFLEKLGVSSASARKDACRMEHILCDETMACIGRFVAGYTEKEPQE